MVRKLKKTGYMAIVACVIMSGVLLLLVSSVSVAGMFARMHALYFEYGVARDTYARACAQIVFLKIAHSIDKPDLYTGLETFFLNDAQCVIQNIEYDDFNNLAKITILSSYKKATSTNKFLFNTKLLIQ